MARRWWRVRKPRGTGESVAALVVGLAAVTLVFRMLSALTEAAVRAWPLLVVVGVLGGGWALWSLRRRLEAQRAHAARRARLRMSLADIDAMNDQDFEIALRDLLIRDGWSARKVGQRGDQAADVIGQESARGRIVLQAKHTTVGGKVGSQVMYQVKGTAGPVHGVDHAVVVTNGFFTRDAMAWGERYQVHWIDRDRLKTWAEQGHALHELLRLSRPSTSPGIRHRIVRMSSTSG